MHSGGGKNRQIVIAAVLILGVVFYVGFKTGEHNRPMVESIAGVTGKESPEAIGSAVDFSPFWEAWRLLDEKYVSATSTIVGNEEKVWGAIGGLAASLNDPYTVFLPPEETELFESEINGNFEGVGMEIGIKDDVLTVIAPLKGTPAERAGIQPGDKIIKINDTVSTTLRVDQAVQIIRGKRGTEVRLTLVRDGRRDPFEITVMREVIDIPTIDIEIMPTGKMVADSSSGTANGLREDGVFVIRLYNFSATAPRQFQNALRAFIESDSSKLLLDLRGNPGGFLEAAVEIASWFLPAGKTVLIEDFGEGGDKRIHRSRGYDVFNDNLKMVILVNGGSASASEILAGALREHGVASLIGAPTFGKGSVQELIHLTPETALKVTVARWFTPEGVSISDGGLMPDIEVKMTPEDFENGRDPQMDRAIQLLNK